jgi:hypothetical protein
MSWESLVNRHKDNKRETSEIDQTFASVFSGPDGKKLLEFFDSIVMNVTIRYMLQQIKNRIKRGKEWQKKK